MARRWPSGRCQRLPGNPSHSLRPTVVWLLAAAVGSVTPAAAQDPGRLAEPKAHRTSWPFKSAPDSAITT